MAFPAYNPPDLEDDEKKKEKKEAPNAPSSANGPVDPNKSWRDQQGGAKSAAPTPEEYNTQRNKDALVKLGYNPDKSAFQYKPTDYSGQAKDLLNAQSDRSNYDAQRRLLGALRGEQLGGARQLLNGPSVAQQQYQNALNDQRAVLASLARSQPGGFNPAVAANLQRQSAAMGQQLAGGSAQAMAQEKLAKQAAYQQALNQIGAQDIGLIGRDIDEQKILDDFLLRKNMGALGWNSLGLDDKRFGANLGASYEKMLSDILNERETGGGGTPWYSTLLGAAGSSIPFALAALMSDERLKTDIQKADTPDFGFTPTPVGQEAYTPEMPQKEVLQAAAQQPQINPNFVFAQPDMASKPQPQKPAETPKPEGLNTKDRLMFLGMLSNALGGLGKSIGSLFDEQPKRRFVSDMRAKENIQPNPQQAEQMMNKLQAYSYNYKDPSMGDGLGPQLGVMAQDLEQSPLGASLVGKDPNGMRFIDTGPRFDSTVLASLANLNDRMRKLGG